LVTPVETSPYRLMQEEFRNEPWKLLVGCICLNQASAKVARPVWTKLFEKWPTAEALAVTPYESAVMGLTDLLRPLGFQNRRAARIWRMSEEYLEELWRVKDDVRQIRVEDLYGIGKYAADSYNMFVKGYLVEDAQDKELRNYLNWARGLDGKEQQAGSSAAG
jgi:endonuclease III